MNTHLTKALPAGGVLLLLGAVMLPGGVARAAAPESLAVFSASSAATPYGVVSRVPVESAGGFLYSKSGVRLGKSLAQAAGFTAGELGDLFVVSSAPPGTITAMPTVINAQEPPSETAPREAKFSGGTSGGAGTGQVQNFDLLAKAADAPSGSASAVGQGINSLPFTSGLSSSRSESVVADDGTVSTKAISQVQNVVIGPLATGLSIAAIDSVASITIPPGKKPVTTLRITMTGATLAGVPITLDSRGLRIADQVALPADALTAFKSGVDALAAQGLTFSPEPRTETVSTDGAKLSGAAFSFRYRYPDAFPRPSDIGTDETFVLGSVMAEATARQRTAPPVTAVAGAPADSPAAPGPESAALPTAPEADPTVDAGSGPAAEFAAAEVPVAFPASSEALETVFTLPARVADPLPGEFRDSYGWVMLAALAALSGLFVIARTRAL